MDIMVFLLHVPPSICSNIATRLPNIFATIFVSDVLRECKLVQDFLPRYTTPDISAASILIFLSPVFISRSSS